MISGSIDPVPSVAYSVRNQTSSTAPYGRPSTVTSRKMPGQPPLILILQIAHRRPLVHPNQDHVLARSHRLGDVELLHQPTALADPDLYAVQPDAVNRLHTVKAKQDPFRRPVRQLESSAMISSGVFVRDMRRIDREGILHVGVDRPAITAFTRPWRTCREAPNATVLEWCPTPRRRNPDRRLRRQGHVRLATTETSSHHSS